MKRTKFDDEMLIRCNIEELEEDLSKAVIHRDCAAIGASDKLRDLAVSLLCKDEDIGKVIYDIGMVVDVLESCQFKVEHATDMLAWKKENNDGTKESDDTDNT